MPPKSKKRKIKSVRVKAYATVDRGGVLQMLYYGNELGLALARGNANNYQRDVVKLFGAYTPTPPKRRRKK